MSTRDIAPRSGGAKEVGGWTPWISSAMFESRCWARNARRSCCDVSRYRFEMLTGPKRVQYTGDRNTIWPMPFQSNARAA